VISLPVGVLSLLTLSVAAPGNSSEVSKVPAIMPAVLERANPAPGAAASCWW